MQNHPAQADITASLAEVLGQSLVFKSWIPVSGGCIHQSWRVEAADGSLWFIKTNSVEKYHTLQAEAQGLEKLHQHLTDDNPLSAPEVYVLGRNETFVWLVLEYIDFVQDISDAQATLGTGLALLHQQTASPPCMFPNMGLYLKCSGEAVPPLRH